MAFTRSMARMRWGRRAPRSSRMRRSRFPVRRRYGRRSSYTNSNKGNQSSMGFSGRRMSYRRYKRVLYDSSMMKEHRRSHLTITTAQSSATLTHNMNIQAYAFIADNFWVAGRPPGGGAAGTVNPDNDIFIRGGLATMAIKNDHNETMAFRLWTIRSTQNGTIPTLLFNGVQDFAWDPTVFPDFQRYFKITSSTRFSVEPGDTHTLFRKIRAQKIDRDIFGLGYQRDFWVLGIHDYNNDTVGTASLAYTHNLSFTSDNI